MVLDCFSGSGTTLATASHLGRKWIGIDNSMEAISTTLRRFAKGVEPMGDYVARPEAEQATTPSLFTTETLAALTPRPIQDFALYASEPYGGEIDRIVKNWEQWLV